MKACPHAVCTTPVAPRVYLCARPSTSSRKRREWRSPLGRRHAISPPRAVPEWIPEAIKALGVVNQVVGSLGLIAAAVVVPLYVIEAGARKDVEKEALLLKEGLKKKEGELNEAKAASAISAKSQVAQEAELYMRRYKEAEKELFKLEKACEMKDSQMESFMRVAQRQIKMLEERNQKEMDA